VKKKVVEECFAWSKKFFDLPLETKMLAPHPPVEVIIVATRRRV
jgi:hypothetical protein